jgi:hypothetical protein
VQDYHEGDGLLEEVGVAGDGCIDKNLSEVWEKGMANYSRFNPPLDA